MVLIDGDDYIVCCPIQLFNIRSGAKGPKFDHRYITAKTEGGKMAARFLKNTIKQLLASHLPEEEDTNNVRIIVRVYANVFGLSKKLARLNIAGREARSLAPFIAGFNQSEPMFDFVDAGNEEDCTANKIMGEAVWSISQTSQT